MVGKYAIAPVTCKTSPAYSSGNGLKDVAITHHNTCQQKDTHSNIPVSKLTPSSAASSRPSSLVTNFDRAQSVNAARRQARRPTATNQAHFNALLQASECETAQHLQELLGLQ